MVKDRKGKAKDKDVLKEIDAAFEKDMSALRERIVNKLYELLNGKISHNIYDNAKNVVVAKGAKFSKKLLGEINYSNVAVSKWTNDTKLNALVTEIIRNYLIEERALFAKMMREKFDATIGNELPNGIVQMAKVYIANKRKLRVGDKMAGRHGNKGIVAKIVKEEDMPFLGRRETGEGTHRSRT